MQSFSSPLRCAAAFTACLASVPLSASDFVAPGDVALRHHAQYLSDQTGLRLLTTTWPLSAEDLQSRLGDVDPASLDADGQRSLQRLLDLTAREDGSYFEFYGQLGSSRQELRGFSSPSRERNEAGGAWRFRSGNLSGELALSAVEVPGGEIFYRLDRSYIAYDLGNWRFGAGRMDQWWGPGWQNSLILSQNARPTPGVFVTRSSSEPFDLPVLRWLGPWSTTLFGSQLEGDRYVPRAKLLGWRVNFMPFDSLEIGLSRTAQWGGEGRPSDLKSLARLLIGNSNSDSPGILPDGSNEPGNQLAGFDWRWSTSIGGRSYAFYGQMIGEDEAGYFPSRYLGMVGFETPIMINGSHGRLYLEATDTTMRFTNDPLPNGAYEHHIYQSGYRYYGQPIGASTDNDSRLLALGGVHDLESGAQLSWKALYGSLNRDGSPAGNRVAPERIKTYMLSIDWNQPINEQTRLSLGAYHLTQSIVPNTGHSDAGVQTRLTYRY